MRSAELEGNARIATYTNLPCGCIAETDLAGRVIAAEGRLGSRDGRALGGDCGDSVGVPVRGAKKLCSA
jgi:hypothetical protein